MKQVMNTIQNRFVVVTSLANVAPAPPKQLECEFGIHQRMSSMTLAFLVSFMDGCFSNATLIRWTLLSFCPFSNTSTNKQINHEQEDAQGSNYPHMDSHEHSFALNH